MMRSPRGVLRSFSRGLSSAANWRPGRDYYPHFVRVQTRWQDNDSFGHVNFPQYFVFADEAVNTHLLTHNIDMRYPRFVASSTCTFVKPLSYPAPADVGLRVKLIGSSSVTYDVGIFDGAEFDKAEETGQLPSAVGTYVHVYVNQEGRPVSIAPETKFVLQQLWLGEADSE